MNKMHESYLDFDIRESSTDAKKKELARWYWKFI